MTTLKKSQFSYKKYIVAGKQNTNTHSHITDSYEVSYVDENENEFTAEIRDIYTLNIFQFADPSQSDLLNAKNWIIENKKV